MMSKQRINILFIASEADPFVKIGGLGDVAGSLPIAITKISDENIIFDIRLVIPFYGAIKKKFPNIKKLCDFQVNTGSLTIQASVFEHQLEGMPVYFIDGSPIIEEAPVYGSNFVADAEKFVFFSLACLELPRILKWKIDILHANDWHTALAIHQISTLSKSRPGFSDIKTILTLHNLPYMGAGSEEVIAKFGIEPADNPSLPVWARTIPLPMGLSCADRIVPVSPTYSQEILTPDFGCGLETFLETRKNNIKGIINGIDNEVWNPSTDQLIPCNYGAEDLTGKDTCKKALVTDLGLATAENIPLVVLISRMDQQKGVDLAINALCLINHLKWQAIILGSGDPKLEKSALDLQSEMPERLKVMILFDSALSHRLYAGADILLMPSRYEPCGLSQLIAMRYGTIPVARSTGGLKDTIINSKNASSRTGFTYSEASGGETAKAITSALENYKNRTKWGKTIINAMAQDFSWDKSAKEYCTLYQEVLAE